MRGSLVVGVDPGLTTGIFCVPYLEGIAGIEPIATQVHGHEGVVAIVQALIARSAFEPLLAVEQFVVGPRSARSSSAHAGRITRALIGELSALDVSVFLRPAGVVKPWATDKRLEAAGLFAATAAMRHARDAARHALFAAVNLGITRDPLSKAVAR